jgi:hypothetical protein
LNLERLDDRIAPATFVVDTTDDTPDALLDGEAKDANGKTSLRAAIQEGNNIAQTGEEFHTIWFTGITQLPSTISLKSALPVLARNFAILGVGVPPDNPGLPHYENA